ncbi:MAG: hypothetical protein J0L66_14885 [Cytophagales bacterium]|nr:hypothetical protein [Cytophagales bacterium]
MRFTLYISICLLIVLISCEEITESKRAAQIVQKETYTRLETGEKQAEKLYTYDLSGRLLKEQFIDIKFSSTGYEIQYEYDGLNRKTKMTAAYTDINAISSVEYEYEGTQLKVVKTFQGQSETTKAEYFYSNHMNADSIQNFYMGNNGYIYSYTAIMTYDTSGRLIEERWRGDGVYITNIVTKMNVYSGDLLMETCNPLTHMPEGRNCIKNEYNAEGNLYRVYATLTGETDRLLEESIYQGNTIKAKKIFNQRDMMPAYNADPTLYTMLVEYEY